MTKKRKPVAAREAAAEIIEKKTEETTVPDPALVAESEGRSSAITIQPQRHSIIAGLDIDSNSLRAMLEAQTQQRQIIKEFIQSNLTSGVDYLRIHVVKTCRAESQRRGSCDYAPHFSKDILAKPGQEKLFSLFQLKSELVRDQETIEMLPELKNLVALKCTVTHNGTVVAEGRGAAQVGDKGRDANATIKIAEKRARMDACLALGFSEYFAQDIDDPDYEQQKRRAEEQAAAEAEDGTGLATRPAGEPIGDDEKKLLYTLIKNHGYTDPADMLEVLRLNGIDDTKTLTSGQARVLILKLKNNNFVHPPMPEPQPTLDPVDEDQPAPEVPQQTEPADPPLIVDDTLKAEIGSRAEMIGLNQYGRNWLTKKITGKPFAKWEQFTDAEWRRAYDVVMGILDSNIAVEDRYMQKS